MIVFSLLLILVAVTLLVLGLAGGSSALLISSIVASLLAAVVLVVGARQAAGRRRAAARTPSPAGVPASPEDDPFFADAPGLDEFAGDPPPAYARAGSGAPPPSAYSRAGTPPPPPPGYADDDAPPPPPPVGYFDDDAPPPPPGYTDDDAPQPPPGYSDDDAPPPPPGYFQDDAPPAGYFEDDSPPPPPGYSDDDAPPAPVYSSAADAPPRADGVGDADSDFSGSDAILEPDSRRATDRADSRRAADRAEPDYDRASSVIGAARSPGDADQSWRRDPAGRDPERPAASESPDEWAEPAPGGAEEFDEPADDDPADEPYPQAIRPGDAVRVARMDAEVLVVDGRPRYHVADCPHLVGRLTEQLPANEAVELGFSPCGLCRPVDRLVAQAAHR